MSGRRDDPLGEMLREADSVLSPSPAATGADLARGAVRRSRVRRRSRRLVAGGGVVVVLIGIFGAAIVRPWFRERGEVARLRTELAELRTRADQMSVQIAEMKRARDDGDRTEHERLARTAFDEQRDRAAFALVWSAGRCERLSGASDVAASAYRTVDAAFPRTAWAVTAREKLKENR